MELSIIAAHGRLIEDREAALAAWEAGGWFQVVGLAATKHVSKRDATRLRERGITHLAVYRRRTSAAPLAVIELDKASVTSGMTETAEM